MNNRRTFLQTLAGLAAAVGLPKPAPAEPPPNEVTFTVTGLEDGWDKFYIFEENDVRKDEWYEWDRKILVETKTNLNKTFRTYKPG